MVDEMKPLRCPFCGSDDIEMTSAIGGFQQMICKRAFCRARGPHKPGDTDAIAAWNRRSTPWRPIDKQRDLAHRKPVFILHNSAKYASDPYFSWWSAHDKEWARWPHAFKPTHVMDYVPPLPAPPEGAGER
jgi:Lar family restriction alleviation protein